LTRSVVLLIAGLVLSGGCASSYQSITDEAEFRNRVVDRALSWPGGFNVRFTADGRIQGRFPAGIVAGTWVWRDGKFCRTISVAGNRRQPECLGIELEPGRIRFKRHNGGYFLPYDIGEKLDEEGNQSSRNQTISAGVQR